MAGSNFEHIAILWIVQYLIISCPSSVTEEYPTLFVHPSLVISDIPHAKLKVFEVLGMYKDSILEIHISNFLIKNGYTYTSS